MSTPKPKVTLEERRERERLRSRAWYAANKDRAAATMKRWRAANKVYTAEYGKASREQLRRQAIDRLGGRCQHCGDDRSLVLTIDHIVPCRLNYRERIRAGEQGHALYRRILAMSNPEAVYQVLCANCNMAKGTRGDVPLEVPIRWAECGN